VKAFQKQFPGATSPFGAPNYVLAQMYANAVTVACKDGKISRAEVRKDFAKVSLPKTILGTPIRFTANGDLAGAKFHIFKIVNGKYQTVQ
jgi:ABC-type branched-subunit amino acid transport system substrate-binding protein